MTSLRQTVTMMPHICRRQKLFADFSLSRSQQWTRDRHCHRRPDHRHHHRCRCRRQSPGHSLLRWWVFAKFKQQAVLHTFSNIYNWALFAWPAKLAWRLNFILLALVHFNATAKLRHWTFFLAASDHQYLACHEFLSIGQWVIKHWMKDLKKEK